MGRGYTQYRLSESGQVVWVLYSAFLDYRFADGSKLHILQDPAWCEDCDRFVMAESIPSVEFLKDELDKLRSGDPETVQIWAFVSNGQPLSDRITVLEKRIKWRIGRVNPPRCLVCGGFHIVALPGSIEFPHPKTGELVVEENSGFCDTSPWIAEFTPEGDALSNDAGVGEEGLGPDFLE